MIKSRISSAGGWRDLIGDIHTRGVAGANTPTYTTITNMTGLRAYSFDPTTMNEVWTYYHIDHDYKPGTPIFLHAHWLNAAATPNTGTVIWGFEYSVAKGHQQQAFPATTTITVTQNCSSTRYLHHIAEISATDAIPYTNLEPDSIILCRVYRDAGSDSCTDPVYLIFADCHYMTDGRTYTTNKSPNFYISTMGSLQRTLGNMSVASSGTVT